MHRVFPTPLRQALLPTILTALALVLSAGAAGQQPGHDAREIAPSPGVTPVETPSSRSTPGARGSRQTPGLTRTPAAGHSAARHRHGRRHEPAIAGGHGSGGQSPPASRGTAADARSTHDPLQPRDVATWILFGVLIVALGAVTIGMLRLPRRHPIVLEPVDLDDLR